MIEFCEIFRDTVSICLVTWFTSLFGGFAIFTVLGMKIYVLLFHLIRNFSGHMATKMGVSVAEVAKGGESSR